MAGRAEALFCGIDVGSSATKAAVVDWAGELRGRSIIRSGVDFRKSARACFEAMLSGGGLSREKVAYCISTGYGRTNVAFADKALTEITCHARGCYHHFPKAITIIDIGGQDSKVIRLDSRGKRLSFKMNRKCAAGTGAFLEEIAARLDVPLAALNGMAEKAGNPLVLGSYCTVFTKTEILARIRAGAKIEDIIHGVFESVVRRILEMTPLTEELVLTGGVVAHNPVLAVILKGKCGHEIGVPPEPQLTGALGAALLARERAGGAALPSRERSGGAVLPAREPAGEADEE